VALLLRRGRGARRGALTVKPLAIDPARQLDFDGVAAEPSLDAVRRSLGGGGGGSGAAAGGSAGAAGANPMVRALSGYGGVNARGGVAAAQAGSTTNPLSLRKAAAVPAVAEAPLPEGWTEAFSKSKGRAYWRHTDGTTSWTRPAATSSSAAAALPAAAEASLPPGWTEAFSKSKNLPYWRHADGTTTWTIPVAEVREGWSAETDSEGNKYYVNNETGESAWALP